MTDRATLTRFAWLSISAAVLTIVLKAAAYLLTGSVGLLSDALESFVNLAGAFMALVMLTIAARPADENHAYGHSKAEYFSSGVEGALIVLAAVSIGVAAAQRLMNPRPLEQIGLGLAVSVLAGIVNLAASFILIRAGRQYHSITLEANAHHLMTDVWTSAGVIVGVGAVAFTGWQWIDPVVALAVAANIIRTGVRIVSTSVSGLMDAALPANELEILKNILEPYCETGIQYHALRTRQSGARRFVSFHLLAPGSWTVQRSHHLIEQIEADIRKALPNVTVLTHLEPIEDPASWADIDLDRKTPHETASEITLCEPSSPEEEKDTQSPRE